MRSELIFVCYGVSAHKLYLSSRKTVRAVRVNFRDLRMVGAHNGSTRIVVVSKRCP